MMTCSDLHVLRCVENLWTVGTLAAKHPGRTHRWGRCFWARRPTMFLERLLHWKGKGGRKRDNRCHLTLHKDAEIRQDLYWRTDDEQECRFTCFYEYSIYFSLHKHRESWFQSLFMSKAVVHAPTGRLKCKPQGFTKGPRSPGRFCNLRLSTFLFIVSTGYNKIRHFIYTIFVFKVWQSQWEAARSLSKQHVALSGILMAFRSLVVRIDLRLLQ